MIELRSGVPGSGKTLSIVQTLANLQSRWEKNPEESRPVFILDAMRTMTSGIATGIPDLTLPYSIVPVILAKVNKSGASSLVPDWAEMPDHSLVIIDEAQGCFPPRSSQSQPPDHVAWLNTHRHRGFDIWLTTQHPKLIDSSVRALVGKHMHYRRLFGGQRSVIYEWDSCCDNLAATGTAITSYWAYPKSVFKWYKSAEVHTKQSFKLPKWLLIPVFGALAGIYFIPQAYSVISNGASGKGISSRVVPEPLVVAAAQSGGLTPASGSNDQKTPQYILSGFSFTIIGHMAKEGKPNYYSFNASKVGANSFVLSSFELEGFGYKIAYEQACRAIVSFGVDSQLVRCTV